MDGTFRPNGHRPVQGRQRLSDLLAAGRIFAAPGAYDPFTARILTDLGFPAVYLGGNALALQLCLGQPLATLTESVDGADKIIRAIDAPLIVDAGAGFGDAAHTFRTAGEFERIGAAAIHIDDQPYPKQIGYHYGHGELLETELVADKLEAAIAARRDPEFRVIARTDALRVTGDLNATVARCQAYAEAGADMLMVLDLTPQQCARIAPDLGGKPLVWIGGASDPGPHLDELAAAGFAVAVYPFTTIAAVVAAVRATWQPLRERGQLEQPADLIADARARVLDLAGLGRYHDFEAKNRATKEARQ
ncbi:isocitrate lyase/PEP mutase family protein [Amycolatopsis acidiphila]|uniref:Isocitrate lyase/PEP mutase family protein n=1 Tax=Amycolatopsis acidiphila TaxID=715473 RepID=A0A558ANU3_9PSEU|nr:isocitrate lyase/PEP mutase family protein [Amycolatopsis acidiphila]TVT25920.1 isocitrate lyase/PEP mutase family protein [Amycolatopsis acidiphila]UIJ63374.1 isocitrate lyase/PEP mutase family protein [Amycolatopsis acidiphila]GHG75248.1 hypothetical protein GCM10017788_40000 [Amycolatopsis acidiphila]